MQIPILGTPLDKYLKRYYSRQSGFYEGVFPEILRHPCNCEIMLLADNTRKAMSKNIPSDSQTKEQLFEKIQAYNKVWYEQVRCIELINLYNSGKRWVRA